eukprot:TRINITY_DN7695_c0_g1_i1.p1 TRINITY_DN7695_c0_g1~~TRINITY_DN7695_c0_g1_i1.p1  ORF type:complete len:190 (+),score=40.68 TRINITY_DN7695_c0_g1_i1:56-571(+)
MPVAGFTRMVFLFLWTSLPITAAICRHSDLPDPVCTPGAVLAVSVAKVCEPGYARHARNVSAAEKRRVYSDYGVKDHEGFCAVDQGCEIDHLVPLETGGANSVTNLWPQPYSGQTWNAHVKDRLENHLHKMICASPPQLPMAQAQQEIATDWIAAYKKYLGPLPEGDVSES